MGQWGNAAQGAAGGAAAGAALGPKGAIVGGLIGGALGYFGDSGESEEQKRYREQMEALSQYQPIQMGNVNAAGIGGYAGAVNQNLAMQYNAAMGQGPSAATAAARMQQDRNAQNQLAMASGAATRGVSAGAAYRNASNANAAGDLATNQALMQARAQEQLAAMSMYGQAGLQAQGQSQDLNMFNANQANQFQVQRAQLEQDERRRQLMAMQAASGVEVKTGPSTGEQLMAGGAAVQSMNIGGSSGAPTPGRNEGSFYHPGNPSGTYGGRMG